jgi:hypothetical protein
MYLNHKCYIYQYDMAKMRKFNQVRSPLQLSLKSMVVARTMNTLAGRFSNKHVEIHGFSGQATEIHWFYFPQCNTCH